jgi:hypothetical protein
MRIAPAVDNFGAQFPRAIGCKSAGRRQATLLQLTPRKLCGRELLPPSRSGLRCRSERGQGDKAPSAYHYEFFKLGTCRRRPGRCLKRLVGATEIEPVTSLDVDEILET